MRDLVTNRIDDLAHHRDVLAHRHHSDYRFRPRFTHGQSTRTLKTALGGGDAALDPVMVERLPSAISNASQDLGQRFEQIQDLAGRPAALPNARKNLQRRDQPVSARRNVSSPRFDMMVVTSPPPFSVPAREASRVTSAMI